MSEVLRINFDRSYKLWSACEDTNLVDDKMEYVYFLNGHAYASNRHIVAKVPLELCTTFQPEDYAKLNNCRIHRTILKMLCSFQVVTISEDWNIINHDGKLLNEKGDPERFVQISAARGDNYINVELLQCKAAPDFESIFKIEGEREPIRSLGIRVKFLGDLCAAMGISSVKMRFSQFNGKVFVEDVSSVDGPKASGVIMPLQLDPILPGMEDYE